jgi:serine/threonine protein kinase
MSLDDRSEELDELIGEFIEQRRLGQALDVPTFAASHPECRDELLAVLPGVLSMESLRGALREEIAETVQRPERLGEYRIVGEIGRGGMGTVYEAIQESLGKRVAIKVLAPAWANEDALCRRFEEEARTVAKLRHTHIVEVYGAGRDGDSRYFVMELVDGVSLDRVVGCIGKDPEAADVLAMAMAANLDRNRFAAEIGRQAALALAYAHGQQILHRDIKPSNLLLDRAGNIHIGDFGLATVLTQEGLERAVSHPQAGTLRYLAPERLNGQTGPASDQYSLGLTLYELLASRPAFPETSPGELMKRIAEGRIEPPTQIPGIDAELATVIGKCLALDPADRYPDLAEAAQDFNRYLRALPIRAKPVSIARRLQLWSRRHPTAAILAGVAALLFVAFNLSILVGYAEVKQALKQEARQRAIAEENARLAATTLDRVFQFHGMNQPNVAEFMPVSPANARLLEELQPFYERISQSAEGERRPGLDVANASFILGTIHVRTARFEQAVATFDRALAQYAKVEPTSTEAVTVLQARCQNERAAAWRYGGHEKEANAAWRQVANHYRQSASAAGRFEAVRALMALVTPLRHMPGARDRASPPDELARQDAESAMELLVPLLNGEPANPEYRFALGVLLSGDPRLERQAGKFAEGGLRSLLTKLIEEHPQQPRYRLEFIRHLSKVNLRGPVSDQEMEQLQTAVRHGIVLLSISPDEPEVIITVADIRHKLAGALMAAGRNDEALREATEACGIFSVLAGSPDAKPEWRLRLMLLEIRQADIWLVRRNNPMAAQLFKDLQQQAAQLEKNHADIPADDYAEIQKQLDRLKRKLNSPPL